LPPENLVIEWRSQAGCELRHLQFIRGMARVRGLTRYGNFGMIVTR